MSISIELPTPAEFEAFPFKPPYEIQVELMRHLYSSIEQKKVTIVESPTGTGKTLSLLCASITWLRDEKDRSRRGKLSDIVNDGVEAKDWVVEKTLERARRELEADEQEYEEQLARARKREAIMRRMAKARVTKKLKQDADNRANTGDQDEDQFLPEGEPQGEGEDMNISPALRALMEKVDKVPRKGFTNEGEKAEPTCTKIYYASRTHSQLTQILPELQRLKLRPRTSTHYVQAELLVSRKRTAGDLDLHEDNEFLESLTPHTRTVALGSRKQLCINDKVRARARDLDESCRELLGEKTDKRCQYLPPIGEETQMLDFRDQILASPKDIEDLAEAGRMAHTCPYFGSRRAIPQAELVVLPYNLLLQKTARETLGIDLTDQIVIIDEAHNLIPTLLSLYTTRLTYTTLALSFQQVCMYISKFRTRLGAVNMLHLKRLVVFLDALKKYTLEWKETRKGQPTSLKMETLDVKNGSNEKLEAMTVAQLLHGLSRKASGVNLLEIEGYLRRSKVARKIAGYFDKETEKISETTANIRSVSRGATPPLHLVEAFMLSLTGTNDDGRVSFSLIGNPGNEEVELKYQLLNPSLHFKDVVDVARAVILAGGTMSPISDVVNQLFSYLSEDRLTSFSCGHITSTANLQALAVGKGPSGRQLEYKADKQGDTAVIAELGQILVNFASIVPAGMVVFFPSYNFLNTAKATWRSSGLLERLENKKKTFFEPTGSTEVDRILQEYSTAARLPPQASPLANKQRGALLFAVIGAKLSEGLNFADDLARAVVIIGLPFANLGSPELRERMQYVKRLDQQRSSKMRPGQKDAAYELYENMCMNAVNQSIGRAIRHREDWASLILLDRRYTSSSIRNKLPKWIENGLTVTDGFGQAIGKLGTFYRSKRVSISTQAPC